MSVHCPKCLSSRTGDQIGMPCRATPGCDGVIERQPEWNELVDRLPERMTCGRRIQDWGPWEHQPNLDYWEQFKADHHHRVCSFCGSMSFEDFSLLVARSASEPEDGSTRECVQVHFSDKGYKIYVDVPGIRNAHQGGIKFYTWHAPRNSEGKIEVTVEHRAQLNEAVRRSDRRFRKQLNEERAS